MPSDLILAVMRVPSVERSEAGGTQEEVPEWKGAATLGRVRVIGGSSCAPV